MQVLRPELGWPHPLLLKQFVVRTKTDSGEPHGHVASNINSRLTYKQIPGSVERHNTAAFAENILTTECINLFSI